VLRYCLRFAPRGLNNLAEPVFGILNRPSAAGHQADLLARFSSQNIRILMPRVKHGALPAQYEQTAWLRLELADPGSDPGFA
jgi:hypothetical protein